MPVKYKGQSVRQSDVDKGIVDPATLWEQRHKLAQENLLRRQSKALGELEGFVDAHREQAGTIYGAKLAVIMGLIDEMTIKDADGQSVKLDTSLVDEKRLNLLFKYVEQFERRAFGNTTQKTELSGQVDVRHLIAQASKGIDAGD